MADLYDSELTYEQRAELRRQKRERSKTTGAVKTARRGDINGLKSSATSKTTTKLAAKTAVAPRASSKPSSLSTASNGGAHVRPRSPTITGIRVESRNIGPAMKLVPDTSSGLANGVAPPPVNGACSGENRGDGGSGDVRQQLHSSPDSMGRKAINPSDTPDRSATKLSRMRSEESPKSGRRTPPILRAHTALEFSNHTHSPRPHSPLEKRMASGFLANIIQKHQDRERSCTPSPSPLTPSPSPRSSFRQGYFSFPSSESKPSGPSAMAVRTAGKETSGSMETQPEGSPAEGRSSDETQASLAGSGSKVAPENNFSTEHASGRDLQDTPPLSPAHSTSSSTFSSQAPPIPASVTALKLEEADFGRFSRMSDISSCSSFEYESFETAYAAKTTPTHSVILQDQTSSSSSTTELGTQLQPQATPTGVSGSSQEATQVEVAEESVFEDSPPQSKRKPAPVPSVSVSAEETTSTYRPLSMVPGVPIVTRLGSSTGTDESFSSSLDSLPNEKRRKGSKGDVKKKKKSSDGKAKQESLQKPSRESQPSTKTTPPFSRKRSATTKDSRRKSGSVESTPEIKRRSKLGAPSLEVSRTRSETSLAHPSSSPGKPPLPPSTPKSSPKTSSPLKVSSSFRTGRNIMDSGGGLSKASMPNLSSAVVTGSYGNREQSPSPEAMGTMGGSLRRKSAKEKKPSSLKRLSMSMRSLVGVGKDSGGTKSTSWQFTTVSASSEVSLNSSCSDLQMSIDEREALVREVEVAPSPSSLGSSPRKQESPRGVNDSVQGSDSDSEYQTASENESAGDYVCSSVSIITVPSDTLARQAGYGPKSKQPPSLPTSSADLLPPSSESDRLPELPFFPAPAPSPSPTGKRAKSPAASSSKKKAAKSEKKSEAKLSKRMSFLGRKKQSSPSSAASKKVSSKKNKDTPASNKNDKGRASPLSAKKKEPSPRASPRASPKASPRASPKASPVAARRGSAPSPRLSPVSGRPTSKTSLDSPVSKQRPSPLTTNSARSPNSSFRMPSPAVKRQSSLRGLPSAERKDSPPVARSRTPLSNVVRMESPPPRQKHGSEMDEDLSASGSDPNFSRFARGRMPVRKPTMSGKSQAAPASTSSSLTERVERIREQKKGGLKKLSLGEKSPVATPSSPSQKSRSSSTSSIKPIQLVPSPITPVAESPCPLTPDSARRRKHGLSLHATPGIHVIESPFSPRSSESESSTRKASESHGPVSNSLKSDIDSLLTSVGKKLDKLESSPRDSKSSSNLPTIATGIYSSQELELGPRAAFIGPAVPISSDSNSPSSTSLVTLGSVDDAPPEIASMPASLFVPFSPTSQSSFEFEAEKSPPPPEHTVSPNRAPLAEKKTSVPSQVTAATEPKVASPLHQARRVTGSSDQQQTAATGAKAINATPTTVKVTAITKEAPVRQKVVPIKPHPLQSSASPTRPKLIPARPAPRAPPTKKTAPRKVEVASTNVLPSPKAATPLGLKPTLSPNSKSESKLGRRPSPQQAVTAALPPKHPSVRRNISEMAVSPSRGASTNSPPSPPKSATKAPSSDHAPQAGVTSTTGMKRPVSAANQSVLRKTSSAVNTSQKTTRSSVSGVSRSSTGRSSIRGSKCGRTSAPSAPPPVLPMASHPPTKVVLKKAPSLDETAMTSRSVSTILAKNTAPRRSMRSKSIATSRPHSASHTSRKGSLPTSADTLSRRDSKQQSPLSHGSPSRRSMRRTSSGDLLKNKPIKPGTTATLRRDRRQSQQSSTLRSSMRVYSSNTMRPTSASATSVRGSAATRSMRVSRTSLSMRRLSATATLPRGSTLTRKPTPPPSADQSLHPSPARKSLKKTSSKSDVFAVFDQISAEAQGSMLTGSDHRRAVRPKVRKNASVSHLKMLQSRSDVTSELEAAGSSKLDPNTYSTYMGKKSLDTSALAGLAAKLDLSTVKLRKTGVMQDMLAEKAEDARSASPNPAAGMEYNTSHPVMLLQVKGRRQVQTRLVEPSGSSLNSGDVFIVVTDKQLFHWIGKSANIIEKARGSDVVMRILHKRELGCKATQPYVLKEEEASVNENLKRDSAFWELLGGKTGVKSSESAPGDEVFERVMNQTNQVFQLEGDKDNPQKAHFVPVHELNQQMVKIALLNTKKILLFDFYSEVYVWVGKQSPGALRKKALELGREYFKKPCRTPSFTPSVNSTRASGRYRTSKGSKSPRHSLVNTSGRRSRVSRTEASPRPNWALFAKQNEGTESILFREKFADWPEPGRIIKMKGHVSSGEAMPKFVPAELQPADVDRMLKPTPPFEGMRLEGDNIHRGQGNYMVSRSTFACNRVRTNTLTKWVIKEFTNMLVPETDHSLFYTRESYVLRWAYIITVVRELEGLTPGQGLFAQDRKHKKAMKEKQGQGGEKCKEKVKRCFDSDSESELVESDEESRRVLESGGRDHCAYFFWQGSDSSLNEKGASALMTVELDKERGPQVRVLQEKEPPAFLNLFRGGMVVLLGRSDTDSLQATDRKFRFFCVRVQERNEAHLLEVLAHGRPLATYLRSRGCYVIYHIATRKVYLWLGSKVTESLHRSASKAAKMLKNRLQQVELVCVNEGAEPKEFQTLVGDSSHYMSLIKDPRSHNYTPRLFQLASTTGEFVATEILYPARNNETEAFPFLQSDIYSADQPAIFILDAHYELYVWLGWWPEQKNKLLKEANATAGSAHSRWLKDKKLALETAVNYVKACSRPRTPKAFMVSAGTEHERFINQFPFWEVNDRVQEIVQKGSLRLNPWRVEAEEELLKYSRTQFKIEDLRKKPPPEGVDPAKLETYLSDTDFKTVFRITREQFLRFSAWKQAEIKKRVGLF